MGDKIFLKSGKRSYSVAMGEDVEKARELIAFFVRKGMNYDRDNNTFVDVYDLVARRYFDEGDSVWNPNRGYSFREATTLLKYFAIQTAKAIAEQKDVEFVDSSGFDGETDILDTHAKNIGESCLEKMVKDEEREMEEARRKLKEKGQEENGDRDIPF